MFSNIPFVVLYSFGFGIYVPLDVSTAMPSISIPKVGNITNAAVSTANGMIILFFLVSINNQIIHQSVISFYEIMLYFYIA